MEKKFSITMAKEFLKKFPALLCYLADTQAEAAPPEESIAFNIN